MIQSLIPHPASRHGHRHPPELTHLRPAGRGIFITSFIIVDKLTPYDLWKQLVEEKNTALAIVVGAAALGICIIIAAAIH